MESPDRRFSGQPGNVALEPLVRPGTHLRSAVLDDRGIQLLARERQRRTIELPPLSTLVGALLWFLVPAISLLSAVDWEAGAVAGVGGLCLWILNRRAERSTIRFADGFIRFLDDTPAYGIREDDDVRWRWGRG